MSLRLLSAGRTLNTVAKHGLRVQAEVRDEMLIDLLSAQLKILTDIRELIVSLGE